MLINAYQAYVEPDKNFDEIICLIYAKSLILAIASNFNIKNFIYFFQIFDFKDFIEFFFELFYIFN